MSTTLPSGGSGAASFLSGDHDRPRIIHHSHDIPLDGSGTCVNCGMHISWAGIEKRCPVKKPKRGIEIHAAPGHLLAAWARFSHWWIERGHDLERPSLEEWIAEFIEWRRMGEPAP